MRVSEMMTKSVASVRRDSPLSEAARMMWDCDCGAVPVMDENGRAIAMITDRDICMAAWTQDRPLSAIRVEDAMSRDLYSCSPEDSLTSAENLMRSKQVRRVPVLDKNQQLAGFLSLADIARRMELPATRSPSGELAPEQVASVLANICQPARAPASAIA